MAILKDLTDLGAMVKTEEIPLSSFETEKIPLESFENTVKVGRNDAVAYVSYIEFHDPHSNKLRKYAQFYFTRAFINKHFKNLSELNKFALVQGKDPNKHWFKLERSVKGNLFKKNGGTGLSYATNHIPAEKLKKGHYYFLTAHRNGNDVYLKLPPELVPLLA